MRILAVTNLWPTPGSFRGVFVAEQVDGLRELGHDVDVEVVAQSRGAKDYLLAAPRVRHRAKSARYDLIHVHYGLTSLSSRLVGRVPRVLSLYGSDINEPWQARITRLTAGRPAIRVYPSKRLVEAAGDRDGVIVPNGIDFDLFTPFSAEDRAAARSRLGFKPDDLVVLFGAAPGNTVKRYEIFTATLDALRERGLPVRELILATPGQARTDVPAKFAAADLLLVTSRQGTESGPLIVKEATAMGLPVVSADVGDASEVLAGVIPSAVVPFPPSDAELVAALAAASAPILEAGTRADGRAKITRYAQDEVARTLESVYTRVLSQ